MRSCGETTFLGWRDDKDPKEVRLGKHKKADMPILAVIKTKEREKLYNFSGWCWLSSVVVLFSGETIQRRDFARRIFTIFMSEHTACAS